MKTKLLLVEDEIDLQQNMKDILEIHDFEVMTADNGNIALDLLRVNRFDIIVSDIMMPEMDGFELLSRVRNNNKMLNLPFIFLSAKVEKNDFRKGMEHGAEDYLTKPVHAKDLVNAVNVAINKKKGREAWVQQKIEEVIQAERNVKYHELRTPLFGIMSILELLTSSMGDFDMDQMKELLEAAHTASKRLNGSLLNLARLNGLGAYTPMSSTVSSVKKQIESMLYTLDKEYEFVIDEDFQIQYDLEIFEFILKEIFENASKFCSKEPVFVSLQKGVLHVSNYQNFVKSGQNFEIIPFGQIDRGYFEQQGLGLGLYLCKVYAEKNNSKLSARITDDLRFAVEIDFSLAK